MRRVLHYSHASTRPTGEQHPCACILAVASATRAPLTSLLHCVASSLLFAGKRHKTSSPRRRRLHQHHHQPSRQSQHKRFSISYSRVADFNLTEGSSCCVKKTERYGTTLLSYAYYPFSMRSAMPDVLSLIFCATASALWLVQQASSRLAFGCQFSTSNRTTYKCRDGYSTHRQRVEHDP